MVGGDLSMSGFISGQTWDEDPKNWTPHFEEDLQGPTFLLWGKAK